MIRSNWLARVAGGLVFAVPLVAFSAPPLSLPGHAHQLQDSIFAGSCFDGPSVLTCASFATSSGYDRFSGIVFNSYFDLNETRSLSDGGFTFRYISCSVLLTTLNVDKNGATLAETLLDPSSQECFTFGYSIINDVYEPTEGFQDVLHVSGAFSSPQFVNAGNQVGTRVDNSTGARFSSKCVLGGSENFLQGGFFINGDFFATNGGVNSQSVANYAQCVYMAK